MGAEAGPDPEATVALVTVFERARHLGLVGPAQPADLVAHALGFAEGVEPPGQAVDLGSGAGLPGLVLAFRWPASHWVLVDAGERRSAFLDQAIRDLDLTERVASRWGSAEELARSELRGQADLVVARSFGGPAVTAECATGFLRVGGRLVVSEPPEERVDRWGPLGDLDLGMRVAARWATPRGHYIALEQVDACPDRYPRRPGLPAKRPLY